MGRVGRSGGRIVHDGMRPISRFTKSASTIWCFLHCNTFQIRIGRDGTTRPRLFPAHINDWELAGSCKAKACGTASYRVFCFQR